MLLLRDGPGHGYELRRELATRALALDPAVLYRCLREMESDGLISSRWMRSAAGPRRRVYDITDCGRAELLRIAASVREGRDARSAFLNELASARAGGGSVA